MKSLIVLRHVPFEDLGVWEPLLIQRGYKVCYYDMGVDELEMLSPEQIDVLVVLGGPIGVYEQMSYPFLNAELQFIRERLQAQRPILGICLGAQLMAQALGATVDSMGHKEIGFTPLQLTDVGKTSVLSGLTSDIPVLHWHGDQFAIPTGAESLATTTLCPHQAFALGSYALGLQFHLEVDCNRIEQWLIGHAVELSQAGIDPNLIRSQATHAQAKLQQAAETVLKRWLDALELP
ncbi:glutamine amidotransferase [Thiofilum flexile]|uniref:glutamine amidotransferase n=1 Tax=Thiofilum flexile TaxID=125627 RepID=UPI00035FE124|nr:glutamine amidotransferase [Thiofilum flexile]